MKTLAIIGGGASGMAAARAALQNDCAVTLFEKNATLGKKLLITGKGRCNLTNDCAPQAFLSQVPNGGKFLYSALYFYPPSALMRDMESLGVLLKTERGNRVFPVSDRSLDVRDALQNALMHDQRFHLIRAAVTEISRTPEQRFLVKTREQNAVFDAVILATGGLSYPATGSTGDGYRFAAAFGHSVTALSSSLSPIVVAEKDLCRQLEGLTLKNVMLSLFTDKIKKPHRSEPGELVFTAHGVSGPLALTASVYLRHQAPGTKMEIDLKPGLSETELEGRILRDFAAEQNRDFKHALNALLPAKMRPVMVRLTEIDPHKKVHQVTKAERARLVLLIKHLPLHFAALAPVEEAVVTGGGVSLREIDPHTMESKLQKGLYFAGELMDVDALTGGFNLQIAFSTGALAGFSAAKAATTF